MTNTKHIGALLISLDLYDPRHYDSEHEQAAELIETYLVNADIAITAERSLDDVLTRSLAEEIDADLHSEAGQRLEMRRHAAQVLKDRFPWLGTDLDAGSGADVIEKLGRLYDDLYTR